jgi:diacylglycerol kinase (ATP)
MATNSVSWFVIINPTSGNGRSRLKWPAIEGLLKHYEFEFDYAFTEYPGHSKKLVQQAIEQNISNIICVGGDGTLHNIVNGIMAQSVVASKNIKVGVIPIGTGNDWVKTHKIPKDCERAIQIIKNGNIATQDLGKIEFLNSSDPLIYFNNLAGIGFDGYVVSKVDAYKNLGAVAYLLGAFISLFSFKNFKSKVSINSEYICGETLMILVGLCKYSGGGMQLTEAPDPFDGLLDVSVAKNFSKIDILKNLTKLFNGKINSIKKVQTLKAPSIKIKIDQNELPFIQADGELVGEGAINITLIPNAFSFYC